MSIYCAPSPMLGTMEDTKFSEILLQIWSNLSLPCFKTSLLKRLYSVHEMRELKLLNFLLDNTPHLIKKEMRSPKYIHPERRERHRIYFFLILGFKWNKKYVKLPYKDLKNRLFKNTSTMKWVLKNNTRAYLQIHINDSGQTMVYSKYPLLKVCPVD